MQAVLSYVQKRRSGNLLGNTPSPFNSLFEALNVVQIVVHIAKAA